MPLKKNPLTDAELAQYEAERGLAADVLQAVGEMKAGKLEVVAAPAIEACQTRTGGEESSFPEMMDAIPGGEGIEFEIPPLVMTWRPAAG